MPNLKFNIMKKITFLLLTILPFLTFGQNFAPNPNLDGTTDWSDLNPGTTQMYDGAFTRTADGSGSWLINSDGTFNSGIKSSNIAGLAAGQYVLSYYVYGTAGDNTKPIIRDNGIGSNIQGEVYTIQVDNTWELAQSTFTVSGTGTVNLRAMVNSSDPAVDFYVDDISFELAPQTGNTLTLNVVGAGVVNLALDQVSYAPTDVETLTAVPATHWSFDSWGGDLTGTNNPETLLMNSDKTVDANFVIDPSFDYAFTFDTDGDLEGWTTDPNFNVINHTGGFVTLEIFQDEWSRLSLQGFPIPSGTYNKVSITLTNDSLNDQLDFIVVNGSTETLTHVMPEGDTSVQTYEYNLTTFTNWTGDVDYVRIRVADLDNPTSGKPLHNGLIIIDDIVFSYDPTLSNQEEVLSNEFSMYPNPNNGELNISSQGTINKVEFFDITGKQVMVSGAFTNHTLLNVSHLNQGIYLVRLTDQKNNVVVKKLVIK